MTAIVAWGPERRAIVERGLILGILAVVLVAGATVVAFGTPMTWDEAVYASRSRSLVSDVPASIWSAYRPPGLPIIGLLAAPFGFSDVNLRAVSLILAVGTLGAVWAFTRMLWGALAALLALLTATGAPVVLNELSFFHTDLPASGVLFVLIALLWREFERRSTASPLLLVAAPLAASAFYLRYGAVIPIAAIAITAGLLWHRAIIRSWRLVAVTIALSLILIVPFVIDSLALTGSPFGVISAAHEQVDTSGPIVAVTRYVVWLPTRLGHVLGFAVIVAGVVLGAATIWGALTSRTSTASSRRYVWVLLPAVITAAGLAVVAHPEPRYMLFPVLLGICAGAGAIATAYRSLRARAAFPDTARAVDRAQAIDRALVIGVLLAAGVVAVVGASRAIAIERDGERSRWMVDVGAAIRSDDARPCVAATTVPPIIGWYSQCQAFPFSMATARSVAAVGPRGPLYVVFSGIDERRESRPIIEAYRALTRGPTATRLQVDGSPPDVELYRLTP